MQCRCHSMRARYQTSKAIQPIGSHLQHVQQCLIHHAVASTTAAGTSLHYALIRSKNTLNNAGWFQNYLCTQLYYALKRYALIQSDFPLRHYGFKWDCSVAVQLTELCTYALKWSQLYVTEKLLYTKQH